MTGVWHIASGTCPKVTARSTLLAAYNHGNLKLILFTLLMMSGTHFYLNLIIWDLSAVYTTLL